MSIRYKLFIGFLLAGLLPMLILSRIFFVQAQTALLAEQGALLTSIANLQEKRIDHLAQEYIDMFHLVASQSEILLSRPEFYSTYDSDRTESLQAILQDVSLAHSDLLGAILIDADNTIVTTDAAFSISDIDRVRGLTSPQILGVQKDIDNRLQLRVAGPLFYNSALIGHMELRFSGIPLTEIVMDYEGLGDTGETLIAQRNAYGDALFIHPLRYDSLAALKRTVRKDRTDVPIIRALQGIEDTFLFGLVDYRDVPVLSVTRYIDNLHWGLVLKIDAAEVYKPLRNLQFIFSIFTLCAAFILLLLSLWFARLFSNPLQSLTGIARRLSRGDFTARASTVSKDEIGVLGKVFNTMAGDLQNMYLSLEQKVEKRTADLENALQKEKKASTALLNVMEDMREIQKNLQDSLQDVERFKFAVDRSNEAIIITDTDGTIKYVNPAFTTITGYSFDEAVGQNPRILQSNKTPKEVYKQLWGTIQKGETFTTDVLINKRKDGTEYNADLAIYPVQEGEKALFYVAVQRDITQRKREERSKSEFVSIASHQLRTPLTAIRWSFTRLQKKMPSLAIQGEIQTLLSETERAIKHMADTITTMLEMSRLEVGTIMPRWQQTMLHTICDDVCSEVEPLHKVKKISFSYDCSNEIALETDGTLLREVVANLLTNAIKYTPNKGSVSLTGLQEEDKVVITVSDTGYGIPKDEQKKIFSRFFRAQNILDKEPNGNGLGLYLVKQITRILGGSITFDSSSEGTTFVITLPRKPQKDPQTIVEPT